MKSVPLSMPPAAWMSSRFCPRLAKRPRGDPGRSRGYRPVLRTRAHPTRDRIARLETFRATGFPDARRKLRPGGGSQPLEGPRERLTVLLALFAAAGEVQPQRVDLFDGLRQRPQSLRGAADR